VAGMDPSMTHPSADHHRPRLPTTRRVREVIGSQRTVEGGGFVVRRPFPVGGLEQIDPFLLLDEMGPSVYGPGEAVGAPDHPHRGFETVTYLLQGAIEHRDSHGGHGVITPGGVQWMTAGAGVVHSEMPAEGIRRLGGTVHGFQLWVNLRSADKMIAPRYQGIDREELPAEDLPAGGRLIVIAGTVEGVTGPVVTSSPVTYAHADLVADDVVQWGVEDGHTALVHVFDGDVVVNGTPATAGQMVVLERDHGAVEVTGGPGRVLLLGGEPLGEPIARYGPFVMNTRDEIVAAIDDFQNGRFGTIAATGTGVDR
jgi:quercetin 2,3-dioxygenase